MKEKGEEEKGIRKVMLVEDDPSYLRVLTFMLKDWGCLVLACRDALEALDVLQYVKPDIIISDFEMPFMSGIEFFWRCREMTGRPGIPFVIISGMADAEGILKEIRQELTGVYKKPVPIDVLKEIVFKQVDR